MKNKMPQRMFNIICVVYADQNGVQYDDSVNDDNVCSVNIINQKFSGRNMSLIRRNSPDCGKKNNIIVLLI